MSASSSQATKPSAPAAYKSGKLLVERNGPITTVTLNRPQVHNALDREISAELNAVVKEINVDRDCRIVVFKGAGNTFCAGDDIKEISTWGPNDGPWQVRMYQETVHIIENMYPITIAAVDGVCTGGGLELTLVCDFVVATDRSRWGMPEINWDITPGWGGCSRLARFAGRRKTKEWNLLGAMFTAETAERYDLVNRLTTPERLERDVQDLIEAMLEKNVTALRCTKHFLNAGAECSTEIGLAFEGAPPRTTSMGRPDGVREFVEKDSRAKRRVLANAIWKD
jgi:enoyl-CoA hydratase/carnithine racemase